MARSFSQTESMRRSASALSQSTTAPLSSDWTNKKGGPTALIEIFLTRGRHPDGLGELFNLTRGEARAIRACGYTARAGRYGRVWRCPALPDELVRGTFLWYLSDAIVLPYGHGPGQWHPKRAAYRPVAPPDPLSKPEKRIVSLLHRAPNQCRTRRQLQQRLSRRIPTRYLDHMLDCLTALQRITADEGWIYPYSRAELEAIRRREREHRRRLIAGG